MCNTVYDQDTGIVIWCFVLKDVMHLVHFLAGKDRTMQCAFDNDYICGYTITSWYNTTKWKRQEGEEYEQLTGQVAGTY